LADSLCVSCGYRNPSWAEACTSCGKPIHGDGDEEWEKEGISRRQRELFLSALGLNLIALGLTGSKFLGAPWGLSLIPGVVLVALGRKVLGVEHSSKVTLAIVLVLCGVALVLGAIMGLDVFVRGMRAQRDGGPTYSDVLLALRVFVVVVLTGATVLALAAVFLTLALQDSAGRLVLWVGFVLFVVEVSIVWAYFNPVSGNGLALASPQLTMPDVYVILLAILEVAIVLIFAAAVLMAWFRIVTGELPEGPRELA
jgi:hypothetical protein